VLAGLIGGFVIGLKPSNALFFGAAVLCLLVARRWTQTAVFLGALVPGLLLLLLLLLLAFWKQRGLGELPALSSTGGTGGNLAAIGAAPVGSLPSPVHRYVDLTWHHLHQNIDGVRGGKQELVWDLPTPEKRRSSTPSCVHTRSSRTLTTPAAWWSVASPARNASATSRSAAIS
jgi:hypothetical protein